MEAGNIYVEPSEIVINELYPSNVPKNVQLN